MIMIILILFFYNNNNNDNDNNKSNNNNSNNVNDNAKLPRAPYQNIVNNKLCERAKLTSVWIFMHVYTIKSKVFLTLENIN